MLALRDGLAGQSRDADLGLELADDRRGRRALGGRDPGSGREGRRHGAGHVSDVQDLFRRTADYAAQFHETLDDRPVAPQARIDELVEALGGPLPDEGGDDVEVVSELIAAAEPGVVGSQTGRYFGFVIGSALPASVAADWLARAWDQNGFSVVVSPAAAAVEEVAAEWLAELLGLPDGVSSGFVTGAQGANTTALAAARQHVLGAGGLGRRAGRAAWGAADPRARRRRASRHDRPVAPAARARHRCARAHPGGRAGADACGRATRRRWPVRPAR